MQTIRTTIAGQTTTGRPPGRGSLRTASQSSRSGFSLVEMLMVILIIAALIPLVAFGARRFLPHYVSAIAVITIGWWTVRLFTNLAADESTGFKVVHTILSIVAIGLSAAILARTTSTMRQRAPSLPDTPETDSVGSI